MQSKVAEFDEGQKLAGFKGTAARNSTEVADLLDLRMAHTSGGEVSGSDLFSGGGASVPGAGPEWEFNEGADKIDGYDIGCLGDACDGSYATDLTVDAGGSCANYSTSEVKLKYVSTDSLRMAPDSEDTCTSGSGRFKMLVDLYTDDDDDGDGIALLVPAMVSGTGSMTKHAWVTEITVVESNISALSVVEVGYEIGFEDDDLLNASTIATSLSGTTTFSTGEVTGRPGIVADGYDPDVGADVVLDMSWTCSDDSFVYRAAPPGYWFTLTDIGCDQPQQVVIRPVPGRLLIQARGDATTTREAPTTPDGYGGYDFTFERGAFTMTGTLTDQTPAQATFDIDSITWSGIPVCQTGTYTFPRDY